jgi:peptidase C39-like protein
VLNLLAASEPFTRLRVLPRSHAIVSWNTQEVTAALEVTVHTADGRRSRPLPYVAFEAGRRASLDGFDNVAKIHTDVVHIDGEIVALDVHANRPLVRVAASTPPVEPPRAAAAPAMDAVRELDVPERSQYVDEFPSERGWCTPASVAMLAATWGVEAGVAEVAAGVFDSAYRGTGNWTFAVAYAGACGLAGAAAYLRDLVNLEHFIAAGLPAAVSISWEGDALPGAPLERSDGHILVVRGFDARGNVIVNDPAQPAVRHVYDRTAFARCWLGHGGVALLLVPPERIDDLLRCANA